MASVRDLWRDLSQDLPWLAETIAVIAIVIAAMIVRRVLARVLRRTYGMRVERAASTQGIADLGRIKRQKTLGTLLESLLRYTVYGTALVVILGIVTPGVASKVFGASLLAVLIGFGLQRLFADVVAGALLLFEGHFAVGDVVTLHPNDLTGVVEEFSLRTTSLRTLGGDRITVTNGNLLSFTRWSYGQREFRIELIADAADAAGRVEELCRAAAEMPDALWIRPPALVSAAAADSEGHTWRMLVTAVVAPGHTAVVEQFGSQLEAHLVDSVRGAVLVLPLYPPAYADYRSGVLLRD